MVILNDFKAQWRAISERALTAVDRVGKSGWLILGSEVAGFEVALAKHWGLSHAVGCASGLDALEIALRCLDLKPGEKVLTTPLSAFATTLAILRAGGQPVFVDVDSAGLIDLDKSEEALKADRSIHFMIPVHLYGHALDLKRLASLKSKYGIKIIEDCAQAIGAKSDGTPVGAVGEIAATSFYPTKNLGCMGDGGALLTNDTALAARAKSIRDYGQTEKYVHSEFGLNSRLDELQAAIMHDALLPDLNTATERRCKIASRYRAEIKHPKVQIPPPPRGSQSVWHLFPLLIDGARADFQAHLKSKDVASALHYPKLISDQEALLKTTKPVVHGELRNAKLYATQQVSIPMHPYLSDKEVTQVIDACNSWRPGGR